jgi:hypothetical protein
LDELLMPALNHEQAKRDIAEAFKEAETSFAGDGVPSVDSPFQSACDAVFRSNTSSYREVIPGFCLARLQDTTIDLHLPYANQGVTAFNARSLDTEVVNPFLHEQRLPAGKSPYLAVFRRQFRFLVENREQVRDKSAYDQLLNVIAFLQAASPENARKALVYALYCYIRLREDSTIAIVKLNRISIKQYETLFNLLVHSPSGGRLPVLLVRSLLNAINEFFHAEWNVTVQEINVADRSSGAVGDVSVTKGEKVIFAAEITERQVERNRVVTTFNTKIAPSSIVDYIFFVTNSNQPDDSRQQAEMYFTQGHDVNFVIIQQWMVQMLITLGNEGREIFNRFLFDALSNAGTPRLVKVAWNKAVEAITSIHQQ